MNLNKLTAIAKDSAMVGITVMALENWFWQNLEKYDPDDIYKFINENKHVKLSQDVLDWAKPFYAKFHGLFEKYTPEYILAEGRAKRPDLWVIIKTHPKGLAWLEEKIVEMRTELGDTAVYNAKIVGSSPTPATKP